MNDHHPVIAEGAFLHRVFGITPGYASVWLCSRKPCEGVDLLTAIASVTIICMIVLAARVGWWMWLVCIPILIAWLVLTIPFQNRERWGRARRRRGECVWCGQENTIPGTACSKCGRIGKAGSAWNGGGT